MWYTGQKNMTKEYTKITYPIHCYDDHYEIIIIIIYLGSMPIGVQYEIIATPINSNRFTDFDLKK